MSIKSVVLQGLKIIIAGCVSLCLLSLFLLCYCDSGVHVTDYSGATDYRYESGQRAVNYEEGFGHFHMDVNGYNNLPEITSHGIGVLLLGSSHMEAANLNASENTGKILNDLISECVYNIGISGHTIYHITSNLPDAISVYQPTKAVIIETDSLAMNVDKMGKVCSGTFPEIKVYDQGVLYYLQKYLPAVKFIYNKIDLWKSAENLLPSKEQIDFRSSDYSFALNSLLSKIRSDAGDLDVIIFYHSKTQIDGDGNYVDPTDPDARAAFIAACEANNITFLDMTDSFENLYNEEHILAHGFANTAVGYGHLNKYGHAIIAEELAKVIQGVEE